jgi:hypothetical protein
MLKKGLTMAALKSDPPTTAFLAMMTPLAPSLLSQRPPPAVTKVGRSSHERHDSHQ